MSSCLESRNDARLHSIALDSLCNPLCHLEGAYLAAFYHANREVVATYEYDSWGNVLKSEAKGLAADNPFGYAGYMYDKEIGMYYLIARYYNPDHGVFLSVDPDPGKEDDPVTQNGYTYADNNPVMKIDPDGYAAIGLYFIPGIGQIALLVTGAVILAGITYKAGSWLGKKAKEYYLQAQNNKQIRKRIEGLEKQIRQHKEKIAKNPRAQSRPHWEKEIRAWENEVARLKKRLKNK
ncbi:Cell wall-associated polypeptide CWBP200 [Streptococcus pneumoniae]|nr:MULTISPECIES: RHS repeat-associated core domain-containing protein [Bacillus cereus group]WIV94105.1 RHS repeat-associated core domain-containing protein [Bacillus bombysepticus]CGG50493.1 Cell wall-associated polypeptide CWBP200 [Streptococcus pneumoniae]MCU5672017.1 hypothetical protein [Bacillus cereus]MDA2088720.1 hypothetical protein [Bacillus cereus]MDA2404861.1 hypothetical protein [Bacillus cereus]